MKGRPFHYLKGPSEDLWKVMWDIIKEAPHNAVKAIWTKGHARREHIDQGKTTLWEMVQNDKADHAAEEGRL